ncbi:MAG: hypothetical protein EON87_00745 [Brevundimonas sp.]|nr:MAG: hypothetical protein EON87_00745 [Brevundimonas sp.]
MSKDQKLSALLSECVADLDLESPCSAAGIKALLRQIEEVSPGEVEAISPGLLEQMVGGLQLARLPRTSAH